MRYFDMLLHDIDELRKTLDRRDFIDDIILKTDMFDNGNKGELLIHAIPYKIDKDEELTWRRRARYELLPFTIYQSGVDSKEVNIIHIRFNEKYTTPDIGLHDTYIDIRDYIDEDFSDVDLTAERLYLALCDKLSSVLFRDYNILYDNKYTFKTFSKIAISKYKMSVKKGE